MYTLKFEASVGSLLVSQFESALVRFDWEHPEVSISWTRVGGFLRANYFITATSTSRAHLECIVDWASKLEKEYG